MKSEVIFQIENQIAYVTINRPQKRNALTISVLELLDSAFSSINSNKEVLCVIFSGAGEEAFCAGADLSELKASTTLENRRHFFSCLAKVILKMKNCTVPIVAKVHGYAMAGGCGLAASCDIVMASDDAKFGLPEVKIGLVPMVVLAPLIRTVNKRALTYMVLSGETIPASEAISIGLATKVYPKKELNEATLKICQAITRASPSAETAAKSLLNSLGQISIEEELLELSDRVAVFSLSDDCCEGINAYLEKRAPSWPSSKRNLK